MNSPVLIPTAEPSLELITPQRVADGAPKITLVAKPSQRIAALDGIRGIAILLVLVRHSIAGAPCTSKFWLAALQPLRLSWSGVDLFFVLSGFLIGGILLDARRSPRYFQTFYVRRAFRIVPVYALFLALYLGRHLPLPFLAKFAGPTSPLSIPWFSFVTLTQNWWMAALGWFGPLAAAPTWSLAVEEQFYLTIPLIIRHVRERALFLLLLAVALGAPLLRLVLPKFLPHGDFACYVLTPCRADSLCFGVLSAMIVRNNRLRNLITEKRWILGTIAGITFIGSVYLSSHNFDQYTPPISTWGLSCLAVFYSSILLAAVCRTSKVLQRVLCTSWLMRLGTVAYCTYLVHMVLIEAARGFLQNHFALSPAGIWAIGGIVGALCAIGVASLSWKWFEKPLVHWGHRFSY